RVGGVARFARRRACRVARLDQAAALGLQRVARSLELGHAADRVLQRAARLARLARAVVDHRRQLVELGLDLLDPGPGAVDAPLLALQLAGQFGHAAVGRVQLALGVLARLLGQQQAFAAGAQGLFQFVFARLQFLDPGPQLLDLAL